MNWKNRLTLILVTLLVAIMAILAVLLYPNRAAIAQGLLQWGAIVGYILIVAIAVTAIVGVVIAAFIMRHIVTMRLLDIEERKQALRHTEEKHAVETRGQRLTQDIVIVRGDESLFSRGTQEIQAHHIATLPMRSESRQQTIAAPNIALPLAIPGPSMMIDIMRTFPLDKDNFFLAIGRGGQTHTCTLKGFMHVAHDASTGGGKTSQSRVEIVQLLKLGVKVILANPHFAPMTEEGEDWKPIARAIYKQGRIGIAPGVNVFGLMRKPEHITKMLKWLSESEIDRRFDMRFKGDFSFEPVYMFIDELPVIFAQCPDAIGYLVDVMRRGRAVYVNVDTSAQDFLVDSVGMNGGARENFNTAYFMGGSLHSGSALLDMPQKEITALLRNEHITLGKGVALLRNNESVPTAQLARLPYADNNFVYYMLGRADDWTMPVPQPAKQDTSNEGAITGTYRVIEEAKQVDRQSLPSAFHGQSEKLRGDLLTVYRACLELKTTNKRTIARSTGLNESTVYLRIKRLQELGYIAG